MPIGDKFGSSWIAITGPVAQTGKPAVEKKDEEVIPGASYVTKNLGIDVDIKDLYDREGKLTKAGKIVQKSVRFKRINDKEVLFYGKEIRVSPHLIIPLVDNTDVIKEFEYRIDKNQVKEIKFEESNLQVTVKFLGEKDKITGERKLLTEIPVFSVEIPAGPPCHLGD